MAIVQLIFLSSFLFLQSQFVTREIFILQILYCYSPAWNILSAHTFTSGLVSRTEENTQAGKQWQWRWDHLLGRLDLSPTSPELGSAKGTKLVWLPSSYIHLSLSGSQGTGTNWANCRRHPCPPWGCHFHSPGNSPFVAHCPGSRSPS